MAVLTQEEVFTEYNRVLPDEVKDVLTPCMVGPHADLHRYSDPDEKEDIDVGSYVSGAATTYPYPGKTPGDPVDLDFVKVFIDDGLLLYFSDPAGGGSGTIAPVGGFNNRIFTTAADGYKENGATFPRDALLKDRDVQVGDVIRLQDGVTEFFTTVKRLIADVIPTSIDPATSDAANPPTQLFADSIVQTAGVANDITEVEDGTLYNGLESGFINETYTILVIQGSSGGDATTALFQITSGSGTDDVATKAPSAFGVPTDIGTRGAKATFSHTVDEFVVGQTWLLSVSQAFTEPVPTSAGTYTGSQTQTYIIEVADGGFYTDPDKPKIVVTSDIGIDSSGPTDVPAAATPVPVGTLGVTIEFTGTALRKGDKYYIVANGPGEGAFKTIETNDNLPAALLLSADMDMDLHIQRASLDVPQERVSSPPTLNWTADQVGVTVSAGIDATDPTLTDGGALFFVPVVSGPNTRVFIQFRAWRQDFCELFNTIASRELVESTLGPVSPDNPLAFAVDRALANSNDRPVAFIAVCDPEVLTDWQTAIDLLEGLKVFSIVPLTFWTDVYDLVIAHVDDQSEDAKGSWRNAWLTLLAEETAVLIDEDNSFDGNVVKATLSDDPNTAGTQFTLLSVTTSNAKFVSKGVRPGDTVRYLFSIDLFGNPTFTEFTVASVVNEDELLIEAPGNAVAVAVPQKVEVYRNFSKTEISQNLAATASAVQNKRIRYLWPDFADTEEAEGVPGYHLAAAFAGFTAGIAPHQGMETIPIQGFTGLPRSTEFFSLGQLNTLRDGGVFTVAEIGGEIFVRHARTTDQSEAETKYESVTRNDDAIRHVVRNRVAQFFGIANLTEATLTIIRSEVDMGLFVLESQTFIDRIDRMVTGHTITDVRISTVSPDTAIIQAEVERPIALGNLLLELILIITEASAFGTVGSP